MASPRAISASSNASTSTSEPLWALPMGVRAAAVMTAWVTLFSLVVCGVARSLRIEADRTVEPDDMAVQVSVGDEVLDQLRELVGVAEAPGEWDLAFETIDEL